MSIWLPLTGLAVLVVVFRNALPASTSRLLGILIQIAFSVLSIALGAFAVWCLLGIKSGSDTWALPLVGFYLVIAAALFVFGRFVGRLLRRTASPGPQRS